MDNNKIELIKQLSDAGVDINFIIQEAFLGYKYRKQNHKLYDSDAYVPTQLITTYYELSPDDITFDNMRKAFIKKYVENESKLEDVHNEAEIKGLKAMYEYIHSDDINYMFDIYTLKDLHKALYSYAPYPEFGGTLRNWDVYLPGTGNELSEWYYIRQKLDEINKDVLKLRKLSRKYIRNKVINSNFLLSYLDKCVIIGCKIIKVHPFGDGNGRTTRGFINKLLEDVGLPPIYVKANERTEYHSAMNKANNEQDYSDIINFYRYKICDSIIELDINDRYKKDTKEIESENNETNKTIKKTL